MEVSKDHFVVEDLYNSNKDEPGLDAGEVNASFDAVNASSTDYSSTVAAAASFSGYSQHFSIIDFCQPCEEVAELEWLSNFVEDCFSCKDYQKPPQFSSSSHHSSSSVQAPQSQCTTVSSVPAKTRSKRSRANPTNWASHIPIMTPIPAPPPPSEARNPAIGALDGIQRCLHCGSDRTPQWRMGPMGPKTLCNACGVRFKSGRLVPEYRPAASPTFVVSEHSNSHRKVAELRRQKELQRQQQQLFWS